MVEAHSRACITTAYQPGDTIVKWIDWAPEDLRFRRLLRLTTIGLMITVGGVGFGFAGSIFSVEWIANIGVVVTIAGLVVGFLGGVLGFAVGVQRIYDKFTNR